MNMDKNQLRWMIEFLDKKIGLYIDLDLIFQK